MACNRSCSAVRTISFRTTPMGSATRSRTPGSDRQYVVPRWAHNTDGTTEPTTDPAPMTAWIVLLALTVAFALAARGVHPNEPPLPPGYDGQRQLAELQALVATDTNARRP